MAILLFIMIWDWENLLIFTLEKICRKNFNNIWNTHFYSRVREPSVVELLMIPDNCFREHSNQSTTSWCSMMDLLISTAVSFFKNKLGLVFRFMVAGYPFYCVRAGRVIVCSIFLNNLGGKRHINTIFYWTWSIPIYIKSQVLSEQDVIEALY